MKIETIHQSDRGLRWKVKREYVPFPAEQPNSG
jgi:hypothetical protein